MSKVLYCERCKRLAGLPTFVRDRRLCDLCVGQLDAWLEADGSAHQPKRRPYGAWMSAFRALCAASGSCNAPELAAALQAHPCEASAWLATTCQRGSIRHAAPLPGLKRKRFTTLDAAEVSHA